MKIDINANDYNIEKIANYNSFNGILAKNGYELFGLRQAQNPVVSIELDEDIWTGSDAPVDPNILKNILEENGLSVDFNFDYVEKREGKTIFIGLRRDIRKDVKFCSNLLKTIIFFFEGRLKLENNFIFPNKPELSTNQIPDEV